MTPADNIQIELARPADAHAMGIMSRDLIETGLGWGWTGPAIARLMMRPEVNAVVARQGAALAGFGVMEYHTRHAHLVLLAVRPAFRRGGLAARLLQWLEACAVVAEIPEVRLELRAVMTGSRRFYERMGYVVTGTMPDYYRGIEDALRMHRTLYPTGSPTGAAPTSAADD